MEPQARRPIRLKAQNKKAGLAARPWHSGLSPGYFIVGMANSAPSLTPDGQREVTVLVLV